MTKSTHSSDKPVLKSSPSVNQIIFMLSEPNAAIEKYNFLQVMCLGATLALIQMGGGGGD